MIPVKSFSNKLSLPTYRLLSARCSRLLSTKTDEKFPSGTMETMLEQAKEQQNTDQAPLLKTKDFVGTQSQDSTDANAPPVKPPSDNFISPQEYEEEVKEMKRKQEIQNHIEIGNDEGNKSS